MPWVEDIKVTFSKTIYTDHNTILCALVINNTYLVTGGKDSLINVFTFDGMKIATLKAHTASVCTLSTIN
jgi:WD40 repeat protein